MTTIRTYSETVIPHLTSLITQNEESMKLVVTKLVSNVRAGQSLFVFGSGHASLFPMELYHRAGGASFVIPLTLDFLLPTAGPPVVRVMERTPGVAQIVLGRAEPKPGEMIWLSSQSGINSAAIDVALEAKKLGLFTVAFTSCVHSRAVKSRHPSGHRLFEICDAVIDLGGAVGDASIPLNASTFAGPLSTLGSVFLGHSMIVAAASELEASGVRCIYTSVNTPEGEARNRALEDLAKVRDPLLRG